MNHRTPFTAIGDAADELPGMKGLHKRLLRMTGQAIADYRMIEDGDRGHGLPVRRQGTATACWTCC